VIETDASLNPKDRIVRPGVVLSAAQEMMDQAGGWLWVFIDVILVLGLAGALVDATLMWRRWKQRPQHVQERDRATRNAEEER